MKSKGTVVGSLMVGAALLAAACGGTTVGIGATNDAGGGADGSTPPFDASSGNDSTVPADSGQVDSATPTDTGAPGDVNNPDTGSMGDSGNPADAGLDSGMCPSTEPSGLCAASGTTCYYPQATCTCTHGAPPMPTTHWECTPLTPGCPQPPPTVGSACSQPGLQCNYGVCIGGIEVQCTAGTWQQVFVVCPP